MRVAENSLVRLSLVLVFAVLAGCGQANSVSSDSVAVESAGGSTSNFAGDWTLSIDTPRGVQNPTLSITQTDAGYTATYSSRQGTSVIDNVTLEGNRFSFPMELTIPIGTIEVRYVGEINGDQLQGVVENPRGQVPFSGVRSGA